MGFWSILRCHGHPAAKLGELVKPFNDPSCLEIFRPVVHAGHAEWISLVPEVDQTLSGKANLESWNCDTAAELAAVPGRWTRISLGQITAIAHFSTCLFYLCCSTQVKKPLLELLSSRR